MNEEMAEFQRMFQRDFAHIRMGGRVPRRLMLGRQEMVLLQRLKELNPEYPGVTFFEGKAQCFVIEIAGVEGEKYFELLPEPDSKTTVETGGEE
jgi:hypothetical protein